MYDMHDVDIRILAAIYYEYFSDNRLHSTKHIPFSCFDSVGNAHIFGYPIKLMMCVHYRVQPPCNTYRLCRHGLGAVIYIYYIHVHIYI